MLVEKEVEKITKGIANHNRIKILAIVKKHSGVTLYEIASRAKIDFRNASEHTRKLVNAGLITKRYAGQSVQHKLTPRGEAALKFCKIIR